MGERLPDICKTVILNAPVTRVWEAVSTAQGIAGWWLPNTLEPIVGHEFVLNAGPYGDSPCTVTEVEPFKRIGFDWDQDWHLTFELADLGDGRTAFTLTHSGFAEDKRTAFGQPHSVVRRIMDGGWERHVMERLAGYVAR